MNFGQRKHDLEMSANVYEDDGKKNKSGYSDHFIEGDAISAEEKTHKIKGIDNTDNDDEDTKTTPVTDTVHDGDNERGETGEDEIC